MGATSETLQGYDCNVGFLAPPSLCRLRTCHSGSLREGVSGVGGVSIFSPLFPNSSLPFPCSFTVDYLCRSDPLAPVAPRSFYFGWCDLWVVEPSHLVGTPWMGMSRVLDKQLTGSPPTRNRRSAYVFGRGPKRCRSGQWCHAGGGESGPPAVTAMSADHSETLEQPRPPQTRPRTL